MKIGFVTTTYPRFEGDGVGVFVSNQVNTLRELGHDVKVIAPEFEGEIHGEPLDDVIRVKFKPRSARKIAYGNGIWPNLKKNPFLFFALSGFIKSIERTIRDEFADREVIEAVFTAAGKALANARRPNQAIVYAGHGSDIHLLESSALYRKYFGKIIKQYDSITVVSQYLANKMMTYFPDARPVVIPNGVSNEVFAHKKEWRPEPTAIYASRIISLKRTDVLVMAWTKVVKSFPNAKLIIFGEGPLLSKCKAIASKNGIEKNVSFRGRVPQNEVWDEMGRGWITVLVSKKEGFGHGLIESLACGCPFISTPCGAAPEIAQKTGGGIIINEPLISEKLAEALIDSFSDKNRLIGMGGKGRDEAHKNFLWTYVVQEKLKLYKSLLK